ncbi:MAG: hypothetical protein HY033_00435 [Ignavibacteriae bacterium]|nr:hypothetical protein [Ignavibacteriota bacterium]
MERKSLFTLIIGGLLSIATVLSLAGCNNDGGISGPTGSQPSILTIHPDSGNVGTLVEITGANFDSGATVIFGRWAAQSVVYVSSTTLLAYASDSIRSDSVYDIQVTNPGGKSALRSHAYKGVVPLLQAVNGVSRPSGNIGSTVIFEGKSFGDLLGKGTVYFSDASGNPVPAAVTLAENWTNEFIVSTVPSGAASGPVWIQTPTGKSGSFAFTIIQAATFSPSLISWTQTQPLPDSSQGHSAVFLTIQSGASAGNLIYVTGGADGSVHPRTTVAYAPVSGSGQLGSWVSATGIPNPRAFHGAVVATPYNALIDTTVAGYLYVIGGIDTSGRPTNTVYRGTVSNDQSVSSWVQVATLSVPLHSMGVTIFRSWLYIAGGATTGNAPRQEVYRARIQQDGSLGSWESQPSLSYPRAYAPLVQFAGVLYVVGGDTGTVAPGVNTLTSTRMDQIHYNFLDLRTGVLKNSSWTLNGAGLIKPVTKHTAVMAGGTILVSGGIYQGAINSSTEHQYASINVDGSIGSFNGATGSHTIAGSGGVGGVPFFNHAAISYVDASGMAHVVILGGNNVGNPALPVPNTYYY